MKAAKEMLSSSSGNLSSKRVVTFMCTLLLVIGFFACFFTDRRVPEYMWNTISFIVMTGLGFTGVEHITDFFKKPAQDG
jgi:hypothetical protein